MNRLIAGIFALLIFIEPSSFAQKPFTTNEPDSTVNSPPDSTSLSPANVLLLTYPQVAGVNRVNVPACGLYSPDFQGQPNGNHAGYYRGAATIYGRQQPAFVMGGMPLISGTTTQKPLGSSATNAMALLAPAVLNTEYRICTTANALHDVPLGGYQPAVMEGNVQINSYFPAVSETGQFNAAFSSVAGFQHIPAVPEPLNAYDYLTIRREGVFNDSIEGFLPQAEALCHDMGLYPPDSPDTWETVRPFSDSDYNLNAKGLSDTQWLDEVVRNGGFQHYQLAVEVPRSNTFYAFRSSFYEHEGVLKTTDFNRIAASFLVNHRFSEDWELLAQLYAAQGVTHRNANGNHRYGLLTSAMNIEPTLPVFKPGTADYTFSENGIGNPAAIVNQAQYELDEYRFLPFVQLQGRWRNHWALETVAASDVVASADAGLLPPTVLLSGDSLFYNDENNFQNHFIRATVSAGQWQPFVVSFTQQVLFRQRHYTTENNGLFNAGISTNTGNGNSSLLHSDQQNHTEWQTQLLGTYTAPGQKLKIKGGLSVLKASVAGQKAQWQVYPQFAAFFDVGKNRSGAPLATLLASYSVNGNLSALYETQTGKSTPELLAPETHHLFETGLLLNTGWLTELQLTYYRRHSLGLLVQQEVSGSFPPEYKWVNNAKLLTQGVELHITYEKRRTAVFLMAIYSTNKITALDELFYTAFQRFEKGHAYNSFYLIQSNGIYQTADEIPEWKWQQGTRPGDVNFTDQNNDQLINANDRVFCGSPIPRLWGNMRMEQTLFHYLQLQCDVSFATGHSIYNQSRQFSGINTLSGTPWNRTADALNRWTYDAPSTTVPRATLLDKNGNFRNSDFFLEKGNYLSVSNLLVKYTFPLAFSSMRYHLDLFAGAHNLFTLPGYSAMSPLAATGGIDFYAYPAVRTVYAGFSVRLF